MRIFPFFQPHAGCPHRCLFCDQQRVSGRDAGGSPDEVAADLAAWLPRRGDGEVAFYGGSFTLLPASRQAALLAAARPFLDAGRVAGIRVSTRPDAVDDERAAVLAAAGVTTVELGCQSFSETVLAACRRGHGAAAAVAAVAALRRAGLRVGLQLMPGLPGSDGAEARASLQRALALGPDFLRIYPTLVLAGTGLAAAWRRGAFRPLDLEGAVELCADLLTTCLQAQVPVARLGLQEVAGLRETVLAGPWHPAFGQLVRSRVWRRLLAAMLAAPGNDGVVRVARQDLGEVLGQRRDNLAWLARRRSVAVVADPRLPRGVARSGALRTTFPGQAGNDRPAASGGET